MDEIIQYYRKWMESIFHGAWSKKDIVDLIKEIQSGGLLVDLLKILNWCDLPYSHHNGFLGRDELIGECLTILQKQGVPLYGVKKDAVAMGDVDTILALCIYLRRYLSWPSIMRDKYKHERDKKTRDSTPCKDQSFNDDELFHWVSNATKLTVINISSFSDGFLIFQLLETITEVEISFSFYKKMSMPERFEFVLDTIFYNLRIQTSLTANELLYDANCMRRLVRILKKYYVRIHGYSFTSSMSTLATHTEETYTELNDCQNNHLGNNVNINGGNSYQSLIWTDSSNGRHSKLKDFQTSVDNILEKLRTINSRCSNGENDFRSKSHCHVLEKSESVYNQNRSKSEISNQEHTKTPPPVLPKPKTVNGKILKKQTNMYLPSRELELTKLLPIENIKNHLERSSSTFPSSYHPPRWSDILKKELQQRNMMKEIRRSKKQSNDFVNDDTGYFEDLNLTKYDLEIAAVFDNDDENQNTFNPYDAVPSSGHKSHKQDIHALIRAQSRTPSGLI